MGIELLGDDGLIAPDFLAKVLRTTQEEVAHTVGAGRGRNAPVNDN